MQREDALDALAERHLADGEGRARAAAVHADHHALEHLDALLVAFAHLDVHANGVARLDRRAGRELRRLDGFNGSHHDCSLLHLASNRFLQQPRVRPDRACGDRPADRAGAPASARSASRRRHRSISAWWPTAAPAAPPCPRNSAGRVYCAKVQQPARERVARHRRLVADHARHEPRDRVDDHQRRQLAARQHVVADRQLLGRQAAPHPLVHPFVAAAQHHDVPQPAQPLGVGVREPPPSGDVSTTAAGAPALRANRFDRRETAAPASAPSPARRRTARRRRPGAGRSCNRAGRAPRRRAARARSPARRSPPSSGRLHHLRKDGDDVDLSRAASARRFRFDPRRWLVQLEQPVRRVDRRSAAAPTSIADADVRRPAESALRRGSGDHEPAHFHRALPPPSPARRCAPAVSRTSQPIRSWW